MAMQAATAQQSSGTKTKDEKTAVRAVVIIKRRKVRHEEEHHGGQWKVAYADFVTAMMAFFLMLWLLNSTTQEQKLGISNYFAPEATSYSRSGSGGVLSGRTLASSRGSVVSSTSPTGLVIPISRPEVTENEDSEGSDARAKRLTGKHPEGQNEKTGKDKSEGQGPRKGAGTGTGTGEHEGSGAARREERRFKLAEKAIHRAIQDSPELRKLADSLVISRTTQGLQIQLIDKGKVAMFPLGSAVMHAHTRELLARIVEVIRHLPNKIAVAGHTDAKPYANPNGYGNWELSSDRANASRRALVALGLPAARISHVAGKADREPLIASDPEDPRNRRISLTLLRDVPAPKDYSDTAP